MAAFESVYARAFADVVAGGKPAQADQAMQQLRNFAVAYKDSRDLREVLGNPAVTEKQKVAVLTSVCKHIGAGDHVRNFLAVLARHDRMGSLAEVLDETQEEIHRRMRIVEAEVITARPLDEAARKQFAESIQQLAGDSHVRARYREDAALLGGALVRIGSTVYDGSLRGQLQKLQEQLAAG